MHAVWLLITRHGHSKDLLIFRDFTAARARALLYAKDDPTAIALIMAFDGHTLDVETSAGMRIALILTPVV